MASKTQITNAIEVLSKVYGKEPGDMSGFYWALEDMPHDTLMDISKSWVQREKWMPAPSELRELCARQENEAEKEKNSRRIRDQAYHLYDLYQEGKITEEQFTAERAVQWVHKQHGIFSSLFNGKK